jgi:hypothetical protein
MLEEDKILLEAKMEPCYLSVISYFRFWSVRCYLSVCFAVLPLLASQ